MILQEYLFGLYYTFISKSVKATFVSRISKTSTFEGRNRIGRGSVVLNSSFGYGSYIGNNCIIANTKIGRFCSIADDVTFCLSVDHILNNLSTYPFISLIQGRNNEDAISKGNIIVEDDVWIGYRATIMSGVKIGQGAVIAAGAVVTKDIPPYAIVGGVPAKVIKYRFSNEIISQLIKVNYANIEDMIKNSNFNILYTHINEDNIDDILDNLNHPERQ